MAHPTPRPARGARPPAIRVIHRYRASPERVFHAWLEPDVARRWLFATAAAPMTDAQIDARVGGAFRLADRRNGAHTGRYVEIVPHHRLVFTLVLGDPPGAVTRVTAEIRSRRTGCELALVHEDVPAERAQETEGRWAGILYGLGETLAAPPRRQRTRRLAIGSADCCKS